jgi:acetylornithine deacetylase
MPTKGESDATVQAMHGETNGGVVLSGHTDVVPVTGQHWSSDPLDPVIRGDGLYGRGSCDMKGFIAVTLGLLPDIQRRALREQLHFAFSFDEELGCLGAPLLLAELAKRGIRPARRMLSANRRACAPSSRTKATTRTDAA